MHFMAVEVESQQYLFVPRSGAVTAPGPPPSFRMNLLHDLESQWWAGIWVLFRHTDKESPTADPDAQLRCFNQAFPCAIARSSRSNFFQHPHIYQLARGTLSESYRNACASIVQLAYGLHQCYEKAERSYPNIQVDNDLLEEAHKLVSCAYADVILMLGGSNIELIPLTKKRASSNFSTQKAKKARQEQAPICP
jgi:hypothetical protein